MIVIDLGCCDWGRETSIATLIHRYSPTFLYGFDPTPAMVEREYPLGIVPTEWGYPPGPRWATHVVLTRQAAWTYDGFIGFEQNGASSTVTEDKKLQQVECFDLANFIIQCATIDNYGEEIVLKMDIEGAEYTLLPYIKQRGVDDWLKVILIEWHHDQPDYELACPIEPWA